jgi:ABC-2 type transport system ATP-binding protein
MNEAVIEAKGLHHRFGRNQVLGGVDVGVPRGSVTAILGRNGVGKSTLLRILVGFMPPTAGDVRVLGLDPVREGPDVRRRVGFVPEQVALPKWMRVHEHMRFLEPFYPTWNDDLVGRLLDLLQLDGNALIRNLSKGDRMKESLLAALAHEPELLLLDEPFSGLDPVIRQQVMTTVLEHLRREERTVVIVTHSIADVERIADRILLLSEGRVLLDGALDDVQRRTMRLMVTLTRDTPGTWGPEGVAQVERDGDDAVLTYLDWKEEYEAGLHADDRVRFVRRLSRDLNDIFLAVVGHEGKSAAGGPSGEV